MACRDFQKAAAWPWQNGISDSKEWHSYGIVMAHDFRWFFQLVKIREKKWWNDEWCNRSISVKSSESMLIYIWAYLWHLRGPFPSQSARKSPGRLHRPAVAEEKAAKEAGMDPENYQVRIRIEGKLRFVYSKFRESGVEHLRHWLVVTGTWILLSHKLGIIIPVDKYCSEGLKPPTRVGVGF